MTRSVTLDARQRQALLDRYRKDPDPEVRFRAHILLLLDDGHTWADRRRAACSAAHGPSTAGSSGSTREGVEGLAGHKPGRPFRFAAAWVAVVVAWVTTEAPRDFGFLRSRWCCEAVALVMLREPSARRQPRDRPPLAAPGRLGLPPPAPDARAQRRGA